MAFASRLALPLKSLERKRRHAILTGYLDIYLFLRKNTKGKQLLVSIFRDSKRKVKTILLTQPFGPHPLRFRMNLAFVKQGNNSSLFLARILGPFPVVVKIQLAKN